MSTIKRIWNFFGSRDLSVMVFITGVTYLLILAIFSAIIPAWWVSNISKLLPFKILYLLFFINLVICEIKWIPVIIRRCKRLKVPETEDDYQRFKHRIVVSGQWSVVSLEKYLRRRGYRVQAEDYRLQTTDYRQETKDLGLEAKVLSPQSPVPSLLYAYRGRFSPIGNLLFHVSFLFLLAGIFISMNYRFEKNVLLMEGQASEEGFEVVEIKPEFWKEKLLFTGLIAGITSEDGDNVVRISKAANIRGTQVTIQGISYTPKYVLRNLGGRTLDVGYVNLANFLPGTEDHFIVPDFPYKIYVSIYPDFEVKDGKYETRSMNLANPRYIVRVIRGKIPVFSGVLSLRDEAFFDGLALSFPEIKYNGTFRIMKDPGVWLIWTAFILMGGGLVWKMLFYRREVMVGASSGRIYLYVNSDYHPALFLNKYTSIVETGLKAC